MQINYTCVQSSNARTQRLCRQHSHSVTFLAAALQLWDAFYLCVKTQTKSICKSVPRHLYSGLCSKGDHV